VPHRRVQKIRNIAEREHNIVHWTEFDRGVHFCRDGSTRPSSSATDEHHRSTSRPLALISQRSPTSTRIGRDGSRDARLSGTARGNSAPRSLPGIEAVAASAE
jgi:hypothetical protein